MALDYHSPDFSSSHLVDSWIESSHSNLDPNFGFIESLYHTCSAALQRVWKSKSSLSLTAAQQNLLKNDVARLDLWEENFPSCRLDTILGHSSYLRAEVLQNLYRIGMILTAYSSRIATCPEDNATAFGTEGLSTLLEKCTVIISETEGSDTSSDSDTDSVCSSATEAHSNQHGRLHCYISCLMELGPAIERQISNIQFKLDQQTLPMPKVFSLSENAQPYARRIKDRFKDAQIVLVERLAEANWERSIRIRAQIEEQMGQEPGPAAAIPALASTVFKPFSTFDDSGLGTSVPAKSQYATTIASHSSFMSVLGNEGEGRPRVPRLPDGGEHGRTFRCTYCGKRISCKTRIQWKIHVFADLQAYICTHDTCKDALRTFDTRKLWADHEFNEHFSDTKWNCFVCSRTQDSSAKLISHLQLDHCVELNEPRLKLEISTSQKTVLRSGFADHPCQICLKTGWQTIKSYATHVGRHMEEISLACLPNLEGDGSESSSQSSQKLPNDASSNLSADRSLLDRHESRSSTESPVGIIVRTPEQESDVSSLFQDDTDDEPIESSRGRLALNHNDDPATIKRPVPEPELATAPSNSPTVDRAASDSSMLKDTKQRTIRCICASDDNGEDLISCDTCGLCQHINCYYLNQTVPETHTCENCEPYKIKCICGFDDDDGNTVFCETCDTWQHIVCYYPGDTVPDVHNCVDCVPRHLDAQRATERQSRLRDSVVSGRRLKKRKQVVKVSEGTIAWPY
ncbi:hypothetical protein BJX99DRAFT_242539 [Aspergillus californicus]